MTVLPAPFAPLTRDAEGLDAYPRTDALRRRMAEVYGVAHDQVMPVRGVTHAVELALRLAARDGLAVDLPQDGVYADLRRLYRLDGAGKGVVVLRAPVSDAVLDQAVAGAALVMLDEGEIDFADAPSRLTTPDDQRPLLIVRSLSLSHGLAGARVGAVLGRAEDLARLAQVLEPFAVSTPSIRLALQALDPSRLTETRLRLDVVKAERTRLTEALSGMEARADDGPRLTVRPGDMGGAQRALARFGVAFETAGDRLRLPVTADPSVNDRILAAFDVPVASILRRRGEAVRDTRETRIVCAVDLDATGPVAIETGVGFFDHMLEQVAAHGGFSLRLSCAGDLHIDPHHTVEDGAIALGQALRAALGERRGIGRYGFVLPMDEAEAQISIDLSGRPYAVFNGSFDTPFIGAYRTDLTAHVVRSLAENLGAAIHVTVTGDDDHHKTEAVFKALGRALRQAIRVEGGAVPSTKGVL